MNNKMKRVGPIAVYLSREQVNALLYLLDCFPAADSNSIFASDAEKLSKSQMFRVFPSGVKNGIMES